MYKKSEVHNLQISYKIICCTYCVMMIPHGLKQVLMWYNCANTNIVYFWLIITNQSTLMHGMNEWYKDRQCTISVTLRRVGVTTVAMKSITYSECAFVALITQHTKCTCHIILSLVACLSLPYFNTLSHKYMIFRKRLLIIKFDFL